ncbi:unnamed protein product [Acanthoscelides obtectus]|uniref:Uncharacterized protein n=1 Tax=Acanthoscelides obtectus TaxID=200917 RepID=A0A9P0LS06_ACAOB|nr:unnamed protein product [Acanthoscelides obtectus]CAK1652116.1 hypothetical protein AOBTE_LOCUS17693 [Acanthoscelides obtectus]
MIEQLEYTNNLQKSVIDSHQQQAAHSTMNPVMLPSRSTASSTLSFSEAVEKIPNRSSVLLIKSDSNSGNNDILRDVTTSVNPAKINVCINNTHKIRNGIAVHCQDEKSLTVLKNSLDKELGSKYSIMEARKHNPRLLIKNVNLDSLDSPESIINNIVALNNIDDTHQSDIKFVTKHYESTNIVIEVSSDLRNILLEKSFLFIGWKKSPAPKVNPEITEAIIEIFARRDACLDCVQQHVSCSLTASGNTLFSRFKEGRGAHAGRYSH